MLSVKGGIKRRGKCADNLQTERKVMSETDETNSAADQAKDEETNSDDETSNDDSDQDESTEDSDDDSDDE